MKKRWNGFAVAGFVMSFTNCLLGLIFSCIGISSSSKYDEKGKGLAIAGLVISILNMIVTIIAIITLSVLLVGFVSNIDSIIPSDVKDKTQRVIIETYAKDQYEEKIYAKEGIKKIQKNAKDGYTFTLEDLEKNQPGIKDFYKSCDSKKTKVTIIPDKPYGKTDYTVKTVLSCN